MSRGGSQTTTQTSAPPAYLQPYLQNAAGQATNLYNAGNPLSADSLQANQMVRDRATYGSPVGNQAERYATNVLQGGMLGANPWLDQAFNKASGAVTNQLQSNFGLSGRNARGVDAAGFAQEGYNDLAAQIYGGNYQAERDRQQQVLGMAPQIANQDYIDAQQLAGVGQRLDPANNLDDYIARLSGLAGGYGVTSSRTPTQSNLFGGLLGLLL